jgi:hypothetical protein
MFSIEFEPPSLREIGGIKDPIPPMGVIVAACANEDHKPRVQRLVRVTVTKLVSSKGNGYVKFLTSTVTNDDTPACR